MERLWAPWRKAYIRPRKSKDKACLFCRFVREKRDARNLVLKRTAHSFAVLNLYPYNSGHVMIVPKRHVAALRELSGPERLDWLALFDEIQAALEKAMKPHAFNAGMNMGREAGAGVPGHLHLHLVPRWNGDVNFMPVLSGTKIISESLASAYDVLSRALKGVKR